MKKITILTAVLMTVLSSAAQNNIPEILESVEKNNTTLKALRIQTDTEKLGNRTDIFLSDPEVEFNYLWGNPGMIGNRKDISVKQNFDIPTITGMKNRQADKQNHLVELRYKADRIDILREARKYCMELIYYNRLRQELGTRIEHSRIIANSFKSALENGDANILDYNKAMLNLSAAEGEMSRIEMERTAVLMGLRRLNGDQKIIFEETDYPAVVLPSDFEEWFAYAEEKSPVLKYVKKEVELSQKQVSLNKAMGLPSLTAGYMREKTLGQNYQGITVGISVPLWDNKNKVKQAKAAVIASEAKQTDTRIQFYSELQKLYYRTSRLMHIALEYKNSLSAFNNTDLLKKALDAGQISLLEYIMEVSLYYETVNKTGEAERDFHLSFAELSSMEL